MNKINKEHRVLDETDLNNINNTFKLIEKTLEATQREVATTRWVMAMGFTMLGILIAVLKFI